jgi:HD-GYP domain-containing protein (c-di-GMP phosphodiesterase class II)
MRKKVAVQDLQIGMFVVELDRPWRETPFLLQGLEIHSDEDIAEITRFCQHVYVILPEVYSDPKPRAPAPVQRSTPTLITGKASSTAPRFDGQDLLRRVSAPRFATPYSDRSTLEEEVGEIRQTYTQASATIHSVMEDVRLGKAMDGVGAKKIVNDLAESVLRNPDALGCFMQLKKKDEYTAMHSLRVCVLALAFGRHLGLPTEELHMLGIGAMLHDVGKTKVPLDILNKPGELTENEFALMKQHVPHGVEILEATPGIPQAAIQVARCHHERHSGGGYINGFKGDQIGLFGMIGGIVDCYDAITSDRSYHTGQSSHTTLKQMYEWRGREFHAGLVEQFIQCMGIYPIGSVVALNTGEVGVVVTTNRLRRLKPRIALVRKADGTLYGTSTIVDLVSCTTQEGKACEIERVLEPGAFGINPIDYLPIPNLLASRRS